MPSTAYFLKEKNLFEPERPRARNSITSHFVLVYLLQRRVAFNFILGASCFFPFFFFFIRSFFLFHCFALLCFALLWLMCCFRSFCFVLVFWRCVARIFSIAKPAAHHGLYDHGRPQESVGQLSFLTVLLLFFNRHATQGNFSRSDIHFSLNRNKM